LYTTAKRREFNEASFISLIILQGVSRLVEADLVATSSREGERKQERERLAITIEFICLCEEGGGGE